MHDLSEPVLTGHLVFVFVLAIAKQSDFSRDIGNTQWLLKRIQPICRNIWFKIYRDSPLSSKQEKIKGKKMIQNWDEKSFLISRFRIPDSVLLLMSA